MTIDAMGCQKAIAQNIIDKKADYVFGLKGNHPTLHQEVLSAFDDDTCNQLRAHAKDFHEEADKGHGRLELRRTFVLREVDWLTRWEAWPKLASLVLVESTRTLRGVTSVERRAYISSAKVSAARFGQLIRSHWGIENQLHWVLDVSFGEDRARVSKNNGAENIAVLRKIALNILRRVFDEKGPKSIIMKKRIASWSFKHLLIALTAGISDD